MREASYSYVLYLVSIGEDIAYLQTPSKTTCPHMDRMEDLERPDPFLQGVE